MMRSYFFALPVGALFRKSERDEIIGWGRALEPIYSHKPGRKLYRKTHANELGCGYAAVDCGRDELGWDEPFLAYSFVFPAS